MYTSIMNSLSSQSQHGGARQRCPFMRENPENTLFWANYPDFGRKCNFLGGISKIPHIGRKFRKYPILCENAHFRTKVSKIPAFRAKMPLFGRKSQKYPPSILGENAPLWAQISKIFPILGKNVPFWGGDFKISPFWKKYPFWGENAPFMAIIPKTPLFVQNAPF